MHPNVFISFASQDLKVAMAVCNALEARGFSCWISARNIEPGDNFQSAIVDAIGNSKVMLLVFSAHSNTSNEMTKELALASQKQLIVVPLRIEDVKPSAALAYEFATRQWIDLFVDWEKAINQLCARLSRAMAPDGADADAPVAPPQASPAQAKVAHVDAPVARKPPARLLVGIGAAVVLALGALVAAPMVLGKKPSAPAGRAPAPAATVASVPAPAAPAAPTPAAPAAPSPTARLQTASAEADKAAARVHHAHARLAADGTATPAVDTNSDAYICAHGDETDFRTIRACDRKDYAETAASTR
jgi:hypothetical protein